MKLVSWISLLAWRFWSCWGLQVLFADSQNCFWNHGSSIPLSTAFVFEDNFFTCNYILVNNLPHDPKIPSPNRYSLFKDFFVIEECCSNIESLLKILLWILNKFELILQSCCTIWCKNFKYSLINQIFQCFNYPIYFYLRVL